ncbi:MAG TPA: glycoside hydrolase family 25 protein [Coriobacteriia bacterium]
MTTFGVDVASLQGVIDWPRVAASGIRFAIARCVREGDLGVDVSYARNVAGARNVGITPGAYCFLSGGGRAATQASLFIQTIGDPAGMLIALDVESGALTPTAADVRTFAAAWRAVWPKHPLLIYGSRGGTLGGLGALSDLGPLWLAAYPRIDHASAADLYTLSGGAKSPNWAWTFGGWPHTAIWQFASTGVVPGISGSVDVDAIETADLAVLTGEADMSAGLKFDIVKEESGWLTVEQDGSWAVLVDGSGHVVFNRGDRKRYVLRVRLATNYGSAPDTQDGFLVGTTAAVMFARNVTPVPDVPPADTSPFTQADVDAKVAATLDDALEAAVAHDRSLARITWQ